MALVFVIDLTAPTFVRLHVLYVFPLAAIALNCESTSPQLVGLILSVVFQLSNFIVHRIPTGALAIDTVVSFASSVMTVLLARAARRNQLAAMNLATTDWLTGLHNRRSFESITDLEIARQKRHGGVFSLAVIDLDDFKTLNDSQGHYAGDHALKILADVLRKHTRESDSIARLGGDEFAVLMPNIRQEDSSSLCRHLSAEIAYQMVTAGYSTTASIGCITFERAPDSTADALHQADKAMYAEKASGKSCELRRGALVGNDKVL